MSIFDERLRIVEIRGNQGRNSSIVNQENMFEAETESKEQHGEIEEHELET